MSKLNKLILLSGILVVFFMKNLIFAFIYIILLTSCDKNSVVNNNPNLPNYTFSIDINLDLPNYNNLNFTGNSVIINTQGAGIRGVILFNSGSGFLAFDAACPNQSLSDCSTMTISDISANCPCDNKKYSLYTGISEGQKYAMKAYQVRVSNKIVTISN